MVFFSRLVFMGYALLLAACVSTPIYQYADPVDYAKLPAYRFDVTEKLFINDSNPTDTTAFLAENYAMSPASALKEWTDKRIIANGAQGIFSVIVKDANMTTQPLKTSGGVKGYFTTEQEEMLSAYLHVILAVEGSAHDLPPAEATISVRASHSIPEGASIDARERIYRSVINELMASFNKEAEKQMQAYFSAYLQ